IWNSEFGIWNSRPIFTAGISQRFCAFQIPHSKFQLTGNTSMCGIIGYIGPKDVVPVLIDGLRRLEYRGYDSAGVAVVSNGEIDLRRSAGKLSNLEQVIGSDPISGDYGVGHTRWATHGRPTEENAH